MSPDEITRLAALAAALRPDWPAKSMHTFIERNLSHRAYGDTAVALAWVCTKTKTETPRLLLEPGAWWQAAVVDGATSSSREPFDPKTTCGICGQKRDRCTRNPNGGHEFVDTIQTAKNARRSNP